MARAMGLVLGQMCGTMQPHTESSILLGLQIGFNARNALVAADLAARGVPSVEHVLEGPFGYYRLFEGEYDAGAIANGLGRKWSITEVSHKPFPSGRATHGVVDGLLEIRARHAVKPEAITRVVASVPPLVRHLVGRELVPSPAPGTARLCAAFVGARALIRGGVDLGDFRPPALTDAATHALAGRFEIRTDDNPDPNALAPGKRPYHTIIPAMVTRESDDSLYASYGVMGGFMQPQGHVQVLSALVDDGADPQAALDRPRFCIDVDEAGGRVAIEEGMPEETYDGLEKMGHPLYQVTGHNRALFGRGQVILRDPETGVSCAGSDPRADGCAMTL